ncbi:MAG: hypothetical protein AABY11_02660, partial [archaeon]
MVFPYDPATFMKMNSTAFLLLVSVSLSPIALSASAHAGDPAAEVEDHLRQLRNDPIGTMNRVPRKKFLQGQIARPRFSPEEIINGAFVHHKDE